MEHVVFTIGHSNHAEETFLALLKMHGIEAVGDVRSTPYSRYNPHFDRETVKRSLKRAGIEYVYLGAELGVRSDDPTLYEKGQVQFGRVAATEAFRGGIARVQAGAGKMRIALMCAEKEPLECHRTILVSRHLARVGQEVTHIHADGHLESQAEAIARLARSLHLRVDEPQLFRSRDEVLEDAYMLQERRITYAVEVKDVAAG